MKIECNEYGEGFENCLRCQENTDNQAMECIKCKEGWSLFEMEDGDIGCMSCLYPFLNEKDGVCYFCFEDLDGCRTCEPNKDGNLVCGDCFNNYNFVNMTKTCLPSSDACPDGTFLAEKESACNNCEGNCETCQLNNKNCIECLPGFTLGNSLEKAGEKRCLDCKSGVSRCIKCDGDQDNIVCTMCEHSLDPLIYYTPDQNGKICSRCYLCDFSGICDQDCLVVCPDKLYASDNRCNECDSTCATCENSDFCLTCIDGYGLFEGLCYTCSDYASPNCWECEYNSDLTGGIPLLCQYCSDGYLLISKTHTCYDEDIDNGCPTGTFKRSEEINICDCSQLLFSLNSCHSFILKVTACHPLCKSCEDATQFNCGECIDSGTVKELILDKDLTSCYDCSEIDENCQDCSYMNKNYVCLECSKGMYSYANKCLGCVDGCEQCSGPDALDCTTCLDEQYYSVSERDCKECIGSCLKCLDEDICIECRSDTKILDSKCYENCPSGYYTTWSNRCYECHDTCKECSGPLNSECEECKQGFYLKDGFCMACPVECKICYLNDSFENRVVCDECTDGFLYFEKEKFCYSECSEGQFKTLDKKCEECMVNCKNCFLLEIFNSPVCNECVEGTYLMKGPSEVPCKPCNETISSCSKCTVNDDTNDILRCDACDKNSDQKYLRNNQCVDDCGSGQYILDNHCQGNLFVLRV